jgi:hypothetical protein
MQVTNYPRLESIDVDSNSTLWTLQLNLTEQQDRVIKFNKTVHMLALPRICRGATVQIFVRTL